MTWFRVDVPPSGGGGTSFDFLGAATGDPNTFELTDATIGNTTATKIPQYMFFNNQTIKRVSLSTITEVQLKAFNGANYIKGINLPNCVTIGESAFDSIIYFNDSPNNSIINIPKCKTVGAYAFRNLRPSTGSISDVWFEWHLDSVETIGQAGFRGANYTWKTHEMYFPKLKQVQGAYALGGITIEKLHIGPDCTALNDYLLHNSTVTNFIIEATTPPTLGSHGLGTPTQLSHIYVPAGSVTAYQSDSRWGSYSSIIEVIPSVTLNANTTTLSVSDTFQLSATTTPSGQTVSYVSSDTAVASVDSSGLITGVAVGTATITASFTIDGLVCSAVCEVTVE